MTTLAIIILVISLIQLVFVLVKFVSLKGIEFVLTTIQRIKENKKRKTK